MLTYAFIVFLYKNFIYFYINIVRYLQRVLLDVSINWHYLHQDAGKTYSERLYWKY